MLNGANLLMEIIKAAWSPSECWRNFNVTAKRFVERTSASKELRTSCELPGEPKEAQWLTDLINTHLQLWPSIDFCQVVSETAVQGLTWNANRCCKRF